MIQRWEKRREGVIQRWVKRREMRRGRNNQCYACTHVYINNSRINNIPVHYSPLYTYLSLLCSTPHLPVLQLPCPGTSCGVMDAFYQNIHDVSLHCPIWIELCVCMWMRVLQVTNTGVRRPGYEATCECVCELTRKAIFSLGNPPCARSCLLIIFIFVHTNSEFQSLFKVLFLYFLYTFHAKLE